MARNNLMNPAASSSLEQRNTGDTMDHKDTVLSPYYAIGRLCTCISPHLREIPISGHQYSYIDMNILIALAQGHEFSYQRNLEHVVGLSHSGLANTLKKMETHGLITRGTCPGNKRDKLVSLTPKGEEILVWYLGRIQRFEEIMYSGISREELDIHAKITMKMAENLMCAPEHVFKDIITFEEFQRKEKTDAPEVMPAENQLIFLNMIRKMKDTGQVTEESRSAE